MANYELRRFDTYPPIPIVLSDNSGTPAIDLTNSSHIKYELKGVVAGLITGYCTLGQVNVTGVCNGSTTVSNVAPTTGYVNGATIYSSGLIGSGITIASGAGTSTLTLSGAAGTGSGTLLISAGLVYIPLNVSPLSNGFTTADTYTGECEIQWSAGGVQTVPNAIGSDFTILVDADEEDG